MKELIISNFAIQSSMSMGDVLPKLVVAMIIGCVVYMTYYFSTPKVTYSGSFGASLVTMTIITTSIMAVISSNIALSLGMVGICCGVSQYVIALASTAVLMLFFLLAKAIRDDKRYILIIRCSADVMEEVKAVTYRHFPSGRLSVQNTTRETAEFIYELKRAPEAENDRFLREIYGYEGVECANFVLQEDATNA